MIKLIHNLSGLIAPCLCHWLLSATNYGLKKPPYFDWVYIWCDRLKKDEWKISTRYFFFTAQLAVGCIYSLLCVWSLSRKVYNLFICACGSASDTVTRSVICIRAAFRSPYTVIQASFSYQYLWAFTDTFISLMTTPVWGPPEEVWHLPFQP